MSELKQVTFQLQQKKSNAEEIAKRKAINYNKSFGNLPFYDCTKCLNKGYIMRVVKKKNQDETYSYDNDMIECSCLKIREEERLFQDANMEKYKTMCLDQFETDNPFQRIMKERVTEYLDNCMNNSIWLVILGQSGAGKTMIASCVANELLKNGLKVRYLVWTDFIAKFKRDISGDDEYKARASEYWEAIKNTEVLYIDELLKRYNETDLKYYIELINYRYSNRLKTLVTSERLFDELFTIDEATASRIGEMTDKKRYLLQIKRDSKRNYRLKESECELL